MNIKNNRGFTLIELMITVAIIGILSAVAIPSYQDYMVRAQVSEAILLASSAKTPIVDFYATKGEYPADNVEAGYVSNKGKYTQGIEIEEGIIVATFSTTANEKIAGKTLSFVPVPNAENLAWTCESEIESIYLPTVCR